MEAAYQLRVSPVSPICEISHAYTHFKLKEYVYLCMMENEMGNTSLSWIPVSELEKYPMGKVDRQIANKLVNR
jgi:adenine-specific DNA glycosylase